MNAPTGNELTSRWCSVVAIVASVIVGGIAFTRISSRLDFYRETAVVASGLALETILVQTQTMNQTQSATPRTFRGGSNPSDPPGARNSSTHFWNSSLRTNTSIATSLRINVSVAFSVSADLWVSLQAALTCWATKGSWEDAGNGHWTWTPDSKTCPPYLSMEGYRTAVSPVTAAVLVANSTHYSRKLAGCAVVRSLSCLLPASRGHCAVVSSGLCSCKKVSMRLPLRLSVTRSQSNTIALSRDGLSL